MKISREIALLLVLKIVETNAGCYWNTGSPGTLCHMYCINSNSIAVSNEIEILYNQQEKEDCRQNGIRLLLRPLAYSNNTIESHWFTAAVKVFELEVHFTNVKSVSADAFNSNAFGTVKKLIFLNLALELIRNGTFNGLDELEVITIQGAGSVVDIEKGVLDTLQELIEFTFEQSSNNAEISINGLTGSEPLTKLEYVKIRYNLTNSINRSTFIGLANVKYLDLSGCQINSIGEHSFDPIANTIEELNLSGNRLTTVPDELFNTIILNIRMIHINGNSWHCDCELLPFRLIIKQYRGNFTDAICSSPMPCNISSILESDCFDKCEIPTTTTTETAETTTIATETTSTETETNSAETEISSTSETSLTTAESSSTTLMPPFYFLMIYIFYNLIIE